MNNIKCDKKMKLKFVKSMIFSTIGVLSVGATTPISLSSCRKKTVQVTGVTLDKDKLELVQGKKTQLKATVLPKNATNKKVIWSSSDPSTASVDQNGNVTAKSAGNATITVTTEDGGYTDFCQVIVEGNISVKSVTLDKDKLNLVEGRVAKLTATVLPENATNKNVTWKSSDESVATVDQNGNVKVISEGNATIIVITQDGSKIATCEVVVTKEIIPVEDVTLDKDRLDLIEGQTGQLTATVLPEDATYKNVTWRSKDESVATVDQNGNVTANVLRTGASALTRIVATTVDGFKTAYCLIVVRENIPVEGIKLDNNRLDLIEGENTQLKATVLPENAANKNVTWSSSDSSIATVDQSGNVTATNPGVATVTAITEDGGYKATCWVMVTAYIPVQSITLDKDNLELRKSKVAKLTATVLPANATNKNIVWSTRSSSDESIATVDQDGNVKAVGEGTTTIHVTTEDGGYTAYCVVTVLPKIFVEGIKLDKDNLGLNEGQTAQLTATVLPEDATNKNVIWKSSDESIATVDQNGKVTAIASGEWGPGLVTITATTEESQYTASCVVIVSPAVKVGESYGIWGDITVKYKLYSNHECRLLTKFMGADSENGYVDGTGVLRIPDHVVWNGENYYVERIPSEWSDGSNNIDGIEFDNVSHLKQICDYAFKDTDALNNYDEKICEFPEGLEYIGTEAFYNVDRGNELKMMGFIFPSTLNAINVRAFANAGSICGLRTNKAIITFKGNFNPGNIGDKAFSPPSYQKHTVQYVYAPNIEVATNIARHIRVCYEDDFETGDDYLIPKVIGS